MSPLLAALLAWAFVAQEDRPPDQHVPLPGEGRVAGIQVLDLAPSPLLLFLDGSPEPNLLGRSYFEAPETELPLVEFLREQAVDEVELSGRSPFVFRDDGTIAGRMDLALDPDQPERPRQFRFLDSQAVAQLAVDEAVLDARMETLVLSRGHEVLVRGEGFEWKVEPPSGAPDRVLLSESGQLLVYSASGAVHIVATRPPDPHVRPFSYGHSLGNAGGFRVFSGQEPLVATLARGEIHFFRFDAVQQPVPQHTVPCDGFAVDLLRLSEDRFVVVERQRVRIVDLAAPTRDVASTPMPGRLQRDGHLYRSAVLLPRSTPGNTWLALGRLRVHSRASRTNPTGLAEFAVDLVRVQEDAGPIRFHSWPGEQHRTTSWNRRSPELLVPPSDPKERVAACTRDRCMLVTPPPQR